MALKIDLTDKIYTCCYCGLADAKVEVGGVYYCPNPFCAGCGATNWKTTCLPGLIKDKDGYQMTEESYIAWLPKGMQRLSEYSKELRQKILALPKTKKIIKELMKQ